MNIASKMALYLKTCLKFVDVGFRNYISFFFIAYITNHHKLTALKQHPFFNFYFVGL